MISAVILAAGRAERMGEPKLFLPLGGKPVLQWVFESALAADLDEVICVSRELESARRQIDTRGRTIILAAQLRRRPRSEYLRDRRPVGGQRRRATA